jgi:hypothetical protein
LPALLGPAIKTSPVFGSVRLALSYGRNCVTLSPLKYILPIYP